eukprot:scaffold9.g3011.t1
MAAALARLSCGHQAALAAAISSTLTIFLALALFPTLHSQQGAVPLLPRRWAADTGSSVQPAWTFDWQAYLSNYPELLRPPHSLPYDEHAAWEHYASVGKAQGHVAARLNVRLRYGVGSGLCNQLYGHLAALILAQELGTEVVLPAAMARAKFAMANVTWSAQPVGSLFDTRHMHSFWASRGVTVHESIPPGFDRGCLWVRQRMPRVSGSPWGPALPVVARDVWEAVVRDAEQYQRIKRRTPACVNLVVGSTMFSFEMDRRALSMRHRGRCPGSACERPAPGAPPLARCMQSPPVAQVPALRPVPPTCARARSAKSLARKAYCLGFRYNHTVAQLADAARQKIGGPFNGVHLRVEKDFAFAYQGKDPMQEYAEPLAQLNASLPLYVASGLLMGGNQSEEFQRYQRVLANHSASVVYKEELLEPGALLGERRRTHTLHGWTVPCS